MNVSIVRRVVALDVGSSGLRAAQFALPGTLAGALQRRRGTPRLERYATVPLPPGAVGGGVVADPAVLGKVLKELWSAGRFTTRKVVFGLANDRVLVRQLDLDWMEPADFRLALPYSVADQIPMAVEDANLDYHVLADIPASAEHGVERTLRILLVAAARDMVEGFVTALGEAGLTAVKAELAPFALIRAARRLPRPAPPAVPIPSAAAREPGLASSTAEAIVDIGAETLTVLVHVDGQPRFVRTVGQLGGRFITGELQQKFGWSYEEAEQAKARYGLPRQRAAGDDLLALEHPAQQAIEERVTAVVAEIRTTLNFFLSAGTGVTRLSRVVLTGGGTQLEGLAGRVGAALGVAAVPLAGAGAAGVVPAPRSAEPDRAGSGTRARRSRAAGGSGPAAAAQATAALPHPAPAGVGGPDVTTSSAVALLGGLAMGVA